MPHLDNWAVVIVNSDPYKAPEQGTAVLVGTVSGHPKHPDGKEIQTSRLTYLKVIGRVAHTQSGYEYSLGEPDPKWVDWMKTKNIEIESYTFGKYQLHLVD